MGEQPRLSTQTLKVLLALLENSGDEVSGAQVGRSTKLPSGTLYPILLRLERAGWLDSRWEAEAPQDLGRPRRRLYRVTALGEKSTRAAMQELQPALGRLAWS